MSKFSREMRIATRQPHALSDALANSKLVLALSDEAVWIDALVVFYQVFKTMEDIKNDIDMPYLNRLYVDECLLRTAAFEKDLCRYYGSDWRKKINTRPEVTEYVDHLWDLKDREPILLLAYVYHLYMGLLSGGQIIRAKRKLRKITFSLFRSVDYVDWVVEFPDVNISSLKKKMKETVDDIAENLTEEERSSLLVESKNVFMYNNKIIKTIKGTNRAILWKLFYVLLTVKLSVIAYLYLS